MTRSLCLALATCVFALSGCVSSILGPRHDPQVVAAVHAKLKAKRFIAVAYEGVPGKDGRRQSVFRFEKSALLDRALISLRRNVSDRSLIQSLLETQSLPETGSFKQEDLARIAALSGAEILIIGYTYADSKQTMFMGVKEVPRIILRAIDLRTREVVNSIETQGAGDDEWGDLTAKLLFSAEGV